MEKFKTYASYFLISFAGAFAALKVYEIMNRPKIAPPATAPVTTTAAATQ